MSFFLLFSLCERIKVPIGESNYLPRLSGANLSNFINRNPTTVIFFVSKSDRLDFANFAISKLSNSIAFGVASKDEPMCPKGDGIAILVFKNGNKYTTTVPVLKPILFTRWCRGLIRTDLVSIRHPDQLREVFETPGTFVLGADIHSRPKGLKSDITFYSVPSVYFQYFGMNISAGIYVYRSADRQLVKATGDIKKYLKSPIVDISLVDVSQRKYFGGFFVDESRENGAIIQNLTKLAHSYPDVYFSLLSGSAADELAYKSNLLYVQSPCFVMFKDGKASPNEHWISQLTDIFDFVAGIFNGTEGFNHLSGVAVNDQTLVYDSYEQVVSSSEGDKLVVFTAKSDLNAAKMKAVALKLKQMVNAPKLRVYSYDLSTNEIPSGVSIREIPSVYIYPEGRDKILYDSDASIEDLMTFVASEATNKFEVPEYDPVAVMKAIGEILHPELAHMIIN